MAYSKNYQIWKKNRLCVDKPFECCDRKIFWIRLLLKKNQEYPQIFSLSGENKVFCLHICQICDKKNAAQILAIWLFAR